MPNLNNFPIHHILLFFISLYLIYTLIRLQNNQYNQTQQYEHFGKSNIISNPYNKGPYTYENFSTTITCPVTLCKLDTFTVDVINILNDGVTLQSHSYDIKIISTDELITSYTYDGKLSLLPDIDKHLTPNNKKIYRVSKIKYYNKKNDTKKA
jgi:hypothetical protein